MQNMKFLRITFLTIVSLQLTFWCEGKDLMVPTPENFTLEYLLCTEKGRNTLTKYGNISPSSLHIYLSSSIKHVLKPDGPCFLENITNLTITGGDRNHLFSTITCKGRSCSTVGIVFSNITVLTIERVEVKHCSGALLPKLKHSTEPHNYPFTFYFIHCTRVMLHKMQIHLDCPFFVTARNTLGNLSLEDLAICVKYTHQFESSYDHFYMYHDSIANRLINKHKELDAVGKKKVVNSKHSLINVANDEASSSINITFSHCNINTSIAVPQQKLPGVLKLTITAVNVVCVIDNLCLINTILSINLTYPSSHRNYTTNSTKPILTIANSNFTNTIARWPSRIALESFDFVTNQPTRLLLQDIRLSNFPLKFMSSNSKIVAVLKNVTAVGGENPGHSTLTFKHLKNVSLSGTCVFKNNHRSAIVCNSTLLHLDGTIKFYRNNASRGGAINCFNSQVIFSHKADISFEENHAGLAGGAIYAVSTLRSSWVKCLLLFEKHRFTRQTAIITLVNNTAGFIGASLYISPLYFCLQGEYRMKDYVLKCRQMYKHFKINSSSDMSEIASDLHSIQRSLPRDSVVYPGQTYSLNTSAVDRCNNKVPAIVYCLIKQSTSYQIQLESGENVQTMMPYGNSTLNYTMKVLGAPDGLKNTIPVYLQLQFQPAFKSKQDIFRKRRLSFGIDLRVAPCPSVFVLSNRTGQCGCVDFLQEKDFACNINSQNVTLPHHFDWLGKSETGNSSSLVLAYAHACLRGYCNKASKPGLLTIRIPDNSSDTNFSCEDSRRGVVCGQCIAGYSVVMGPNRCFLCESTNYFSVVAPFLILIGGMLYVLTLWVLKLTVDKGTLATLSLCASILTTILRNDDVKPVVGHYMLFLECVVSLLSLSYVGKYPICLWNGLTNLQLVSANFFIPIYLWGIVFAIILCTRKSSLLSSVVFKTSVQVLTTLLHLSYSTLSLNALSVFMYVKVHMEGNRIQLRWLLDGSVHYGTDPLHCLLIILSIGFYFFFIIPYTLIGLFGSRIVRFHWIHSYLRPFIDTMHAPYRHRQSHWFGLRLLLLQGLFIIDMNCIYSIQIPMYTLVLCGFLVCQIWCNPFKERLVAFIDYISFLFLVICLIVQLSYDNRSHIPSYIQTVYMSILFTMFLFTVSCHAFAVLNCDATETRLYVFFSRWFSLIQHKYDGEGYESVDETEETSRFRESLLN